jgi:tetratricopeptide (TPR) repeat protein
MSRPRLIALLLALITLVVYLPVTRDGFLNYDDNDYVTENSFVKNGLTWAGIKWAFTTSHAANWHPITWLSHMTDCELFGLNPGAHHLVSALFHSANAALLFVLLLRLTKRVWPSAIIAALFSWHPLHVESVAWISERKDVLSTFFALLALLSYAKYMQESCGRSFRFAFLFFALGLMAKPMLVTLPFVMLLLDFWPLQRMKGHKRRLTEVLRLAAEKIPLFLLTAISCIVTFLVQHSGHAVASLNAIPLHYRLENAPVATASYLWKIFWPSRLAVIYPIREISAPVAVLAVAMLVFISVAVWFARKKSPCWLFGWLWFLGTLVPVIGLVQIGSAALADRYTYIPSIGIFIAVVFGLQDLLGRFQIPKIIFPTATAFILVACVVLTEKQLRYWRDSETLFRHTLAVTKNNDVAHIDLGVALDQQNKTAEALAEYREAARLNPDRYQVHNNIAILLDKLGRPAEALAEYREAIRLDPKNPILHSAAGTELAELGQSNDALKEFSDAEQLDPAYATPHAETAKVFFQQGRDTEAVDELRAALRCEPDNFQSLASAAHYLAANENAAARDGKAALVLALKANALSGNSQPMVFDVLGMAFAETGDFTNAQTCAQNALTLATNAQMKKLEPFRQRLELYKNHRPWRESFLATNAPVKILPKN